MVRVSVDVEIRAGDGEPALTGPPRRLDDGIRGMDGKVDRLAARGLVQQNRDGREAIDRAREDARQRRGNLDGHGVGGERLRARAGPPSRIRDAREGRERRRPRDRDRTTSSSPHEVHGSHRTSGFGTTMRRLPTRCPMFQVQQLVKSYGLAPRGRRRLVHGREGRAVRSARPQRRGQDDHHVDALGASRARRGTHPLRLDRSRARAAQGQSTARRRSAGARALREPLGAREPPASGEGSTACPEPRSRRRSIACSTSSGSRIARRIR